MCPSVSVPSDFGEFGDSLLDTIFICHLVGKSISTNSNRLLFIVYVFIVFLCFFVFFVFFVFIVYVYASAGEQISRHNALSRTL